nr:MAG TPA: hypothetical protein [Caudoviricetes sp.]
MIKQPSNHQKCQWHILVIEGGRQGFERARTLTRRHTIKQVVANAATCFVRKGKRFYQIMLLFWRSPVIMLLLQYDYRLLYWTLLVYPEIVT